MTVRVVIFLLVAGASLGAQVSFDRILRAQSEPQNWLTYSGNLQGHRYSPLTQVTSGNVRNLELAWAFQAMSLEKFEATPIALDGVLFTVQPPNDVVAIDGTSGRVFWTYTYRPSQQARPCCGRVNRGLAILGESLFMGTIDGRLVALDARSGRERWNVAVTGARPEAGYALTVAPLVVKDKIIAGPAGGDFGVRGFISAFDPRTGKELWRFHTVPGPGEKGHDTWAGDSWVHGGSAIWTTGTYDPELNLTYWGTGNPGPDFTGDTRAGDNLYSDSVVALDPDTGALKWYFQFTPHDEFDYDSTQVPVLADIQLGGRLRKVLLLANRNGFWYVLDRATGEFLSGKPFAKVTWTTGLDAKGRPQNVVKPTPEGTAVFPHLAGATNWYSPSVQPEDWTVLRADVAGFIRHLRPAACRIRRGAHLHGRVSHRERVEHQRHTDQPPASERWAWCRARARSEDRREEMGVHDGRRHRRGDPHDRVGSAVLRRAGRILLRARRANGSAPVEGAGRRHRSGRAHELQRQRPAVRGNCGRQFTVRVHPAAVNERLTRVQTLHSQV